MKCSVTKEALATGLRRVLSVVSTKTTLPILGNVLVEAEDGKLALTTTDLEVSVTTTIDATVEVPGATTLPAKKFGQIVNVLPVGDVSLETTEDQLTSLSCMRAFFKIVGLSPEEFPRENEIGETWKFTMPAIEFKKDLNKVSYAASAEDARRVLTGILLSLRDGVLTTAATDGRRLALVEKPLQEESQVDGDVILPPKLVIELQRVLEDGGELNVEVSDSRIIFNFGTTVIISKLVEGAYPNYRQVIPQSFSRSAVFPRETFVTVLTRVGTVVAEASGSVRLDLQPAAMTVKAVSTEFGESEEPMDISYDGEPVTIAFNPLFLLDPLKNMEADQVTVEFNDQFSPISLSGDEGFLCIVMPMRN